RARLNLLIDVAELFSLDELLLVFHVDGRQLAVRHHALGARLGYFLAQHDERGEVVQLPAVDIMCRPGPNEIDALLAHFGGQILDRLRHRSFGRAQRPLRAAARAGERSRASQNENSNSKLATRNSKLPHTPNSFKRRFTFAGAVPPSERRRSTPASAVKYG